MNRTNFSNLLTLSSRLSLEDTEQIASIVKEFPYFQAARALHLKGLKNQESFKYNKNLKTTAAYTTDRSVLFDFITSNSFVQNAVAEQIKQNHEGLKTIPVLDFEDVSIQSPSVTTTLEVEDKKEEDELLNLGMPLEFDKGEAHSFSQWLKLTKISPIDRPNNNLESSPKQQKNINLIDAFIAKKPKIQPQKKSEPIEDLASDSDLEPIALMTETLARIYLEQKNFKKALQSYKILSLKYPEKSSLFADQIKAIKKIQEKNKNT